MSSHGAGRQIHPSGQDPHAPAGSPTACPAEPSADHRPAYGPPIGGMAAMDYDAQSLLEIIPMAPKEDPQTLPPPDPRLARHNPMLRSFRFKIVQQPIRARMCGSSDKDWRPLSPPVVLKLELFDWDGNQVIDNAFMQQLVVHATLWNETETEQLTTVELPHNSNSKRISAAAKSRKRGVTEFGTHTTEHGLGVEKNLLGDYSASSSIVEDEHGVRGCFFVYPNLPIRLEGRYRLNFMLLNLQGNYEIEGALVSTAMATVSSDAFDVYSIKTFPGMIESTPLSRALAQQGLKIPIRNTQDSS